MDRGNAAPAYGPAPGAVPAESTLSTITYRVRHIPTTYSREEIGDLLRTALKLTSSSRLRVGSIAPDLENENLQVATISFHGRSESLPIRNQKHEKLEEWTVVLKPSEDVDGWNISEERVTIDTHFRDFTPLNRPKDGEGAFDLIAVSGLGGHAFGSFKQRDGEYMWLRDGIPQERTLESIRVIIYGYDSRMVGSRDFQGLGAIASTFKNRLKNLRRLSTSDERPIVFLGHSLGGLVIKEALIQMAEGAAEQDDTRERKLLFATYALLFFGVPSRGMEIRSLMIMVQGQPNAPFISMLDRNSEPLARQHRRFCEAFPFTDSKVFSFYETQQSPTAVEISGRWEMSGPMEVLVDITSATQSRGAWESKEYFFQPISKSHSELVKYSREDEYYKLVKGRLEDVAEKAAEIIHQRFQAQSRSAVARRSEPTAHPHSRNLQESPRGLARYLSSLDVLFFDTLSNTMAERLSVAMPNPTVSGTTHEVQTRLNFTNQERELELRENFLLALESSESDLSSKSIPKRSAGTCDWFFDTEQYSKWIDEPQPQTLVITAPTGRGKSVLANYLVERLQHNGEDNLILSCFCKDEKNDRKKAMPIVRHLLYQLLSGKTELLRHIPRRALIMEGEKAFTFQNLWDVMMDVLRVSSLKTVFCIIDGLDECDEESSKMLREAFERDVLSTYPTSRPVRARFLITSQPIEAALLLAQKSIYLGILPEHVNNDILEYVHDGIKSLKRVGAEMKISQELAGYIGEEITQRAGGSFQWAKLVLKELGRVPTSRNRIMQVLEQVPKSLQGLYEACFRKISPERLPKARRILTILLFSSRALTPGELAICMLENPNQYRAHAQVEGDFDHSMGWEANITCGSFLDVTDKFVNITHQSARESLMSFTPQHSSSNDFVPFDTEEGHRVLAMSCLSYLLLDDIQKVSSEDQDETLGEKFPFLKYAEANWHIHLRNVRNLEGFTGVLQDFLSRSTLRIRPWRSAWPEMLECFPRWEGSQDSAIFHLLVHTGLLTLLKRCELVPRGTGIDTIFGRLFDGAGLRPQAEAPILRLVAEIEDEDALGNTPLLRAMKKFNWDVTFWLFLNKYADLSAVNDQGCTISHFAAQADSEDFIWMLRLWRVDTNRVDGFGYTPLKYALLWGCENAARALLQNTPARDLRSDITPLHLVAKSGYETLLPLALKRGRGVGVNQGTISKTTGLMMASERGHDGIVLRLLAEQADADLKDDQGMSALHYAALEGKDKIVQILLDHGVLPDEIDDLERTALHLAAQGGYEEAVRHLLPKVSDLDARDVDGSTALYHAAAANCLSIVKLLVGRGADINQASRVGRTPFHVATVLGHFDVARFFAEQSGILLDTVTDKGYTPLCSAASNGFEEIVSLLLCHNVDVEGKADSKDMSDRLMTPLQLAADNGFQTIVERLVGAKALVNSVSRDGYTPLLCAAVRNHPKIVSFLLEKGANPDCVASTGWNPLHCAARDGHEGLVTRFLELGVDASSRTTSGLTPIYLACENGSIRILEILIGWGGNVRATSDSGSTPLHAAVGNEREDVVRRLIRMKVYVSQETDKGTTPLILAAGKDNPGIMKLLLENGASCQEPPPECWSPLHEAAFGGLEKNVALLLKHHHPVDALDEGETTPLLWAANQGHVLVVKTLLSNNANIKALSKTGLSFLICAVRSRSEALVRLGVEKGADINWANSVSDSPIAISIDQGDRKLFNIFLSQGALLLAEPVAKRTALHQAAQSGFEGIVQDLLAAGSDPNVRDIYGCTPLHLAAWCYRKATVRTLVDHGGDLRALDCFGRTGYYWARRRFNHGLGKSNRVLVPELEPIHHRQRLEQSIRFCVEKLLQHQIEHYHYYHYSILGKCLQFEGDSENARIAFEQTMHQTRHPNMVHIASCNVCGPDRGIEGCRYVCGSCADIDLCSRCFEGKWNPGLLGRGCFSHKFLQVPGPDWESRPAGVVDSHGLTVEEWLRGLRTPRSAGLQNWEKGTWTKTEQQMQSRPGFWDLIDTFSGSADDVRKEKEEEELSDISTENSGAEKDEQEKDETTDRCDQPRL